MSSDVKRVCCRDIRICVPAPANTPEGTFSIHIVQKILSYLSIKDASSFMGTNPTLYNRVRIAAYQNAAVRLRTAQKEWEALSSSGEMMASIYALSIRILNNGEPLRLISDQEFTIRDEIAAIVKSHHTKTWLKELKLAAEFYNEVPEAIRCYNKNWIDYLLNENFHSMVISYLDKSNCSITDKCKAIAHFLRQHQFQLARDLNDRYFPMYQGDKRNFYFNCFKAALSIKSARRFPEQRDFFSDFYSSPYRTRDTSDNYSRNSFVDEMDKIYNEFIQKETEGTRITTDDLRRCFLQVFDAIAIHSDAEQAVFMLLALPISEENYIFELINRFIDKSQIDRNNLIGVMENTLNHSKLLDQLMLLAYLQRYQDIESLSNYFNNVIFRNYFVGHLLKLLLDQVPEKMAEVFRRIPDEKNKLYLLIGTMTSFKEKGGVIPNELLIILANTFKKNEKVRVIREILALFESDASLTQYLKARNFTTKPYQSITRVVAAPQFNAHQNASAPGGGGAAGAEHAAYVSDEETD